MASKKHILVLTPGFPADEQDSQCIPALHVFVKTLKEDDNVHISVISLHYPQRHGKTQWYGIDFYSAYANNKLGIFFNAWKWVKHIHSRQSIDIIHSFWLNDAALLGHWIGKSKGIPHLCTLMGQDVRPSNSYLKFLPLSRINTIGLSDFHARKYLETTGNEVDRIIPWGINLSNQKDTPFKRPIDILGVGNLIPLKAYDQFVHIVKKLHEKGLVNKVELIGDGPEKSNLEKQVKQLGLDHVIHVCGKMDREEVLQRMQQSKILLHTSTFESFGMVFLEALENGAYVVSRKVGIASVSDRWLLADTKDSFIEKCLLLLENKQEHYISIPYPIKDTVATYLDLYSKFK